MMSKRDPARSYETLDDDDLARLGRVADADVEAFFARTLTYTVGETASCWSRLPRVPPSTACAESAASGISTLIVCFVRKPTRPHPTRRQVLSWDWGPSKFGRCPFDPPDYTGRAVDVKYWTIPDASGPDRGLAGVADSTCEAAARSGAES
jgi:hypothetical protein